MKKNMVLDIQLHATNEPIASVIDLCYFSIQSFAVASEITFHQWLRRFHRQCRVYLNIWKLQENCIP